MRLSDFAPLFLEISEKDGNSAGELAQKRMALRNHICGELGELELESIGVATIREFTALKVAEGLAPKTVNNLLGHVARLLHVAAQEGHRLQPLPAIKRLPAHFAESRFLLPEEATALLEAARVYGHEWGTPHYGAMISLCLHTGLRIGELLAVQWGDVEIDKSRMHVRRSWCRVSEIAKVPKNGHHRVISLNSDALSLLRKLRLLDEGDGRIFAVRYQTAHRALVRIAELAGLDNIGWHTLRHTFASWLVTAGVPLFTVSRMLGHQSMKQTERYAHLDSARSNEAVGIIHSLLTSQKDALK